MQHRITRRALAGIVTAVAAAAQQPPAPLPTTPDEELDAARAAVRRNLDQIARVKLPQAIEPAVSFKA